jgi:hypothetical protein
MTPIEALNRRGFAPYSQIFPYSHRDCGIGVFLLDKDCRDYFFGHLEIGIDRESDVFAIPREVRPADES